jgi:hypothetical protein
VEKWDQVYNRVKYPLPFYNYYLELIKTCQSREELFRFLIQVLRWKLGDVREGKSTSANTVTINGRSFTWSDNDSIEKFKKYSGDVHFLRYCFSFRNGLMDGRKFFKYLHEEKRVFGKSLVLHIFLMHALKPEEYPIIDQHVWRAMKVFQRELESLSAPPEKWDDYERYRNFFNAFLESLCKNGRVRFDRHSVDRALMSFGKWIKSRKGY